VLRERIVAVIAPRRTVRAHCDARTIARMVELINQNLGGDLAQRGSASGTGERMHVVIPKAAWSKIGRIARHPSRRYSIVSCLTGRSPCLSGLGSHTRASASGSRRLASSILNLASCSRSCPG
jgi:hypothetical protein